MTGAARQRPVHVVYPAVLFDGREVVAEQERDVEPAVLDARELATAYAESRAVTNGSGVIKRENWFGDTEGVREVPSRGDCRRFGA
jgi:hypothetical protein